MTRSRFSSIALTLLIWAVVSLGAQAVSVTRIADAVAVKAPGFTFIKGEPLARLKDGRALRADLDLSVLPRIGGAPAAHNRRTFALSYDLWEERFAVATVGTPAKSASYLTTAQAEAWCLDQLTVPIASLGSLGQDAFWVRLEYRILGDNPPESEAGTGLSIRTLIDAFSSRRKAAEWSHSMEAGPFRLRP